MGNTLYLSNNLQEIKKLEVFVDELSIQYKIMPETNMQMHLALEEAVVNIINHANLHEENAYICLRTFHNDNELIFLLTDTGDPFDPTLENEIRIDLPLEDRDIGGLGILLIRSLMDEVAYKRVDEENHLILKKKIKQNI